MEKEAVKQKSNKGTMSKGIKEVNPLSNTIVYVRPVIRPTRLLPKNHSGNWQYDATSIEITPRLDIRTGYIIDPLTPGERLFFENSDNTALHGFDFKPGDLSVRKENNFWSNFSFKVRKEADGPIKEDNNLLILDLSNSIDYFKYAVLKTNAGPKGFVAEGWDNRFDKGSNRLVLIRKEEENKEILTRAAKLEKVNKFFYSINTSVDDMTDFMTVAYYEIRDVKRLPDNRSIDWLKAEMQKLIDTKLTEVLSIIEDDKNYKSKVFIQKAVSKGLITFNTTTQDFRLMDGGYLGQTLTDAMDYLEKPENQESLLKIKAQLSK